MSWLDKKDNTDVEVSDGEDEVFEEDHECLSLKGLAKVVCQVMDERDRRAAKKIPINNADINNVNAIPECAPSTGKLSICQVPNKRIWLIG